MTDKEQIDSLAKKVSDYADEVMKLKQENNALKKRVSELENTSKKKRKFRAMTNAEFFLKFCGVVYRGQSSFNRKPYQTKDGKYLFIEVKNESDIIRRTGKKYIIIKVKNERYF